MHDDTVFIPTAKALELYDRDSLFEIQLHYAEGVDVAEVVAGIKRILIARHGDEDLPLFIAMSEALAVAIGLVAGVLPAVRAAELQPVEALREE